jgi:hypothetical protein
MIFYHSVVTNYSSNSVDLWFIILFEWYIICLYKNSWVNESNNNRFGYLQFPFRILHRHCESVINDWVNNASCLFTPVIINNHGSDRTKGSEPKLFIATIFDGDIIISRCLALISLTRMVVPFRTIRWNFARNVVSSLIWDPWEYYLFKIHNKWIAFMLVKDCSAWESSFKFVFIYLCNTNNLIDTSSLCNCIADHLKKK